MSNLFDKFKSTAKQQETAAIKQPFSSLLSRTSDALSMTDEQFRKFRDFIYTQSGIYFIEAKKYLLEGRINKRLSALELASFDAYFTYISNPVNRQKELPALFESITINETYFFRNEPQFAALENIIIPELLKEKMTQPIKKFRFWSAASSSGEEAYTLAMIILEHFKPRFPSVQFEVVGTDISPAVVAKAQTGVYQEYAVKNMPKRYLDKYFTLDAKGAHVISPEVRKMVRFSRMNLYDITAMRSMRSFDIIFCCNVLIYFDQQSKQQVIAHLYDALNKGGYLFIGYSESLHGISKAFNIVHFPKTIAYKKE